MGTGGGQSWGGFYMWEVARQHAGSLQVGELPRAAALGLTPAGPVFPGVTAACEVLWDTKRLPRAKTLLVWALYTVQCARRLLSSQASACGGRQTTRAHLQGPSLARSRDGQAASCWWPFLSPGRSAGGTGPAQPRGPARGSQNADADFACGNRSSSEFAAIELSS